MILFESLYELSPELKLSNGLEIGTISSKIKIIIDDFFGFRRFKYVNVNNKVTCI